MIKALIVLNGPNGNIEFEVGKKAGSHPERAEVKEIYRTLEENAYYVTFSDGEEWTIYTPTAIIKRYE